MLRRIILGIVLAVVVRHVYRFSKLLGFEKTIYNHTPGDCHFVPGIDSGSEDLELLSDGTILISAGYLSFKERVEGAPRGNIYVYDINSPDGRAQALTFQGDFDTNNLHPHGISAYEDKKTGKTTFFIINHHVGFDTVDIFDFDRSSKTLTFIRSRQDPLMESVNNLVAVGPNAFYVTNEAHSINPHIRLAEELLLLKDGCIVFCDNVGCRAASEALIVPNGIDLSRDGRYLYVSQPFEKRISIFERSSDNTLLGKVPVQTIDLGTVVDNVYVDDSGDLWMGCMPMAYKALLHMEDYSVRVPSQVLRVKFGSDSARHESYELNEVYSNDGLAVTMSTSAVYRNGVLLIGTLHEKMMRCDVRAI